VWHILSQRREGWGLEVHQGLYGGNQIYARKNNSDGYKTRSHNG